MIIATLRSLRWADYFLFTIIDPRALYRQIKSNDPRAMALSFTVPVIVAVTELLSSSLLGRPTTFFFYKISYGWILHSMVLVFLIIITAALMDLVIQFMGMKGNVRELIIVINYAVFPKVFLLPLVYIFKVINFAPGFFYVLFSLGLFIWSAFITIQALSEMHAADFGKALLIFLFPIILMGIFIFFGSVLFFFSGMGLISSML